jgi:hypothetical protein
MKTIITFILLFQISVTFSQSVKEELQNIYNATYNEKIELNYKISIKSLKSNSPHPYESMEGSGSVWGMRSHVIFTEYQTLRTPDKILTILEKDKVIHLSKNKGGDLIFDISQFDELLKQSGSTRIVKENENNKIIFSLKDQKDIEIIELVYDKKYLVRQIAIYFKAKENVKYYTSITLSDYVIKPASKELMQKYSVNSIVTVNNNKAEGIGKYKNYTVINDLIWYQ